MGKKRSRPQYTSKGQRRCHARWLMNLARRENRENPSIESKMQRIEARQSARGALREKYDKEDSINRQAGELYDRYEDIVTWAACVQAVKTDWVSNFHNKYGPQLKGSN